MQCYFALSSMALGWALSFFTEYSFVIETLDKKIPLSLIYSTASGYVHESTLLLITHPEQLGLPKKSHMVIHTTAISTCDLPLPMLTIPILQSIFRRIVIIILRVAGQMLIQIMHYIEPSYSLEEIEDYICEDNQIWIGPADIYSCFAAYELIEENGSLHAAPFF
ncbi:hypothetical protein ACJX0J_015526 [Zea mays]